jgi:hypothetical protein
MQFHKSPHVITVYVQVAKIKPCRFFLCISLFLSVNFIMETKKQAEPETYPMGFAINISLIILIILPQYQYLDRFAINITN